MFCCPGCWPSRRVFIAGAASAAATRPKLVAAAEAGPRPWVDAHCHVFNALDLPIAEFIEKTQDSWPVHAISGLIAFLVGGLKGNCPTAQAEAAALSGRSLATLTDEPSGELSTYETLRLIRDPGEAAPATLGSPGARRPPAPVRGAQILEDELRHRRPDRQPGPPTDDELGDLAASLDGPVHALSTGSISQQLRWGQGFSDKRVNIVERLVAHYPKDASLVLTPAWVDYSRWLGIPAGSWREPTSLLDQIEVSAALTRAWARGRNGRQVLVTGFAPFDPARCLMPTPGEPDPVAVIDAALGAGRIIGVKLYPPMGFRAIGNDALKRSDFPELIAGARPSHPAPSEPGPAIDWALKRLYDVCLAHDAPIMAHCADSQYTEERFGARADPAYWIRLLSKPPYDKLRVNLAHFGGVWDFGKPKADKKGSLARAWATAIANAVQSGPHRFPNLYMDVGYASSLLTGDANDPEARGTLTFLEALLASHPEMRRRIMYGSDWQMVGRENLEDRYSTFVDQDMSSVLKTPGQRDDFRWGNAARFLGLAAGGNSRRRIGSFLGADAKLIERFLPV